MKKNKLTDKERLKKIEGILLDIYYVIDALDHWAGNPESIETMTGKTIGDTLRKIRDSILQ